MKRYNNQKTHCRDGQAGDNKISQGDLPIPDPVFAVYQNNESISKNPQYEFCNTNNHKQILHCA
jgi:hypothetical protein